jgi:antitoxin component of MazEF toxin-antitoxin module
VEQSVERWIVQVEQDEWGFPCITIPDSLLAVLQLDVGDTISWIDNNDGSFTLKKKKEEEDDSI